MRYHKSFELSTTIPLKINFKFKEIFTFSLFLQILFVVIARSFNADFKLGLLYFNLINLIIWFRLIILQYYIHRSLVTRDKWKNFKFFDTLNKNSENNTPWINYLFLILHSGFLNLILFTFTLLLSLSFLNFNFSDILKIENLPILLSILFISVLNILNIKRGIAYFKDKENTKNPDFPNALWTSYYLRLIFTHLSIFVFIILKLDYFVFTIFSILLVEYTEWIINTTPVEK